MRSSVLALFLCATAPAFCQSGTPTQPSPYKIKPTLPPFTQPWKDFGKLPPVWHMNGNTPLNLFSLQSRLPPCPLNDARIDPKIILQPPQSRLGVQPPGINVAQNKFPGLKFLPIDATSVNLQPIPGVWPNAELKAIPTLWPKGEILSISTGATPPTETQGK
jgi:hypothetical protein